MFNLSGSELIVIALLALVVLGPEKLPGAIRRVGRVYAELKRISSGFESEFRAMIDDTTRPVAESTPDPIRSAEVGSAESSDGSTDQQVDRPTGERSGEEAGDDR